MNKTNYRRLKAYFVIILGIILFAISLFWESGQTITWAAQTDNGNGTINPGPTSEPGDNDNDDDSDNDDDNSGGPGGKLPGGGPPGGLLPDNGTRGPNLADLSLRKWVNEPLPYVGQVITYTIVISNSGPRGAFGVYVLDQLPMGVVLSDAVATRGKYYNSVGLWDVGVIRVTERLTLNLISVVSGTGRITNTAEITRASPTDPDSIPANGVQIEDDLAYAVITPTLTTTDQAENERQAAFMDQVLLTGSTQTLDENNVSQPENNPAPGIEAPNLAGAEASVKAMSNPAEVFPLTWILLLSGGIVLIVAGLWLAKH
ncbi:MAG: DUF11 domain-containing protein [Anaerolineae bacterium]|nr:DUF11 domain-containing protein [Anaerolineae bacterium]